MVVLLPVGQTPIGTGDTEEGHAFRTWLSDNGDLFHRGSEHQRRGSAGLA